MNTSLTVNMGSGQNSRPKSEFTRVLSELVHLTHLASCPALDHGTKRDHGLCFQAADRLSKLETPSRHLLACSGDGTAAVAR